jgi:hypothetical protein
MTTLGHILGDLFGTGTWGTGGNLVASAILGTLAYLVRGPLGRWLGKHIAPHVAGHVAAHLNTQQTPATATPDAGATTTATPPAAGPSAAAYPPATAAEGAVHHEPEPAPQHTKGSAP